MVSTYCKEHQSWGATRKEFIPHSAPSPSTLGYAASSSTSIDILGTLHSLSHDKHPLNRLYNDAVRDFVVALLFVRLVSPLIHG